jgi:maltooligosyltrehalose trehalohydrolase
VTFRVWAPYAQRVDVVLESGQRHEMRAAEDGYHALDLAVAPGTRYAYSLDGGPALPDPRSRSQPSGVHGPSAVRAPRRDRSSWRPGELRDRILYELHVGTFTPEGTFDAAARHLDELAHLGIDTIELMPLAEFPGERGWGYDGVDLYAPHHGYGGPDGLDRLIDAAHARGIGVIVDVVYNHLGPDGNYLERFGPYFTDRHHTPWGKAINADGPDSDAVRAFIVDNALMWLEEHDADGVRLDAIQAIVDLSATHILEELAARVHELGERTGRRRWVIAESDLNDPRVVRDRDRGGWGCDAQWSDDLHHALHTVLTGEHAGYYGDFGRLEDLAKALRDVFVYDGRRSAFRRRHHGRPVGDLPADRFLAYTQDHDQVGNRARGERLVHLCGVERAKIAAAVVLLSPFVPMLFMGEEWAASSPFLYFTDHPDERLGRAVSEGRRNEFERFGWDPSEIVDPQSTYAFERSHLDRSEREREPHRSMHEWYRALIALRRSVPELRDGRRDLVDVAFDEDARWLRMTRGPVTCAFALDRPAAVPLGERAGELALASVSGVRISDGAIHLPRDSVAIVRS